MATLKGRFTPQHPEKYDGDPTNIWFRSSWELRVMQHLDRNPNVVKWQSEEFCIPYRDPVSNRVRRYFPDFLVTSKTPSGDKITTLIEVKPKNQTAPPEVKSRKSKRYITEVMTWGTNEAKWNAAIEYCKDRKWVFKLVTEDDLFGKK